MRRRHRYFRLRRWIFPFFVACLFGFVALSNLFVTSKPVVNPASLNHASAVNSSTVLLLAVPEPKAAADKLFSVSLTDKSMQEIFQPAGWRVSSLAPSTFLSFKQTSDGATILNGAEGWSVPLRTNAGLPYTDPLLLGMFDDTDAAVMATNDGRMLLSVSRSGEKRVLMTITDDMEPLRVDQQAVWLSKFTPGPGIESGPTGPSSLIRVMQDGTSSTVMTDQRLVTFVMPGPSNAIAYAFDNGDMIAQTSSTQWNGQGYPLVWLDASHLVISQGIAVEILDLTTSKTEPLIQLPAAPTIGVVTTTKIF